MPNNDITKQHIGFSTRGTKKFPVWRRAFFAITVLLVCGLVFVNCNSNETRIREKVTVGISKSFLSIPVYIAQKQGFFSDEGLDVTVKEYSSGKVATNALFSGEVDISTVADMPIVFNSFKRNDFCIFASKYSACFNFLKKVRDTKRKF